MMQNQGHCYNIGFYLSVPCSSKFCRSSFVSYYNVAFICLSVQYFVKAKVNNFNLGLMFLTCAHDFHIDGCFVGL